MFNLDLKSPPEPHLGVGWTHPKFQAAENGLCVLLGTDPSEAAAKDSAGAAIAHFYRSFSFPATVDFEWSAFNLIFLKG